MPGFVDTHLHGGGGANFSTAARDETATAVEFHRRHGTTTLVASLVTAGPEDLLRQVAALADDVRSGVARRNPSGRAVALHAAVRRPSAVVDAGSRPRRDRPRSRNGRRCRPHGHHRAGTRRRPCRDPADRRRRRGCRRRPHRSDVRHRPGRRSTRARRWAPICSTRCVRSTPANRGRSSRCSKTQG